MLSHLRPALVSIALFTALTGLAYPLAITGLAQGILSGPADGSLLRRGETIVGSSLIGQNFTADRYFHGRPSATSAADPADSTKTVDAPYDADSSAASNLGPTSAKLIDRVKGSVAALGGAPGHEVPADAVTTSASGLDPDISLAFAALQAPRVADARKLPLDKVKAMVRDATATPALGIFGETRVNVLTLNIALDAVTADTTAPQKPAS